MSVKPTPAASRFWPKVNKEGPCWEWLAGKSNRYGKFNPDGKPVYAHRWSYEFHFGPIPEGLFVCHTCDNPICVKPTHFFLGTNADNMADMSRKGRAANKSPTHCKHGHEYTAANSGCKNKARPEEGKYCLTCSKARGIEGAERASTRKRARYAAASPEQKQARSQSRNAEYLSSKKV